MSRKIRSIIGTWPNPSIPIEYIERLYPESKRGVAQLEMGDSGLVHIQYCVQFRNPVSMTSVQRRGYGHVEPCKALVKSMAYCSKEEGRLDGPYRWGETEDQVDDRVSKKRQLRDMSPESAMMEDYQSQMMLTVFDMKKKMKEESVWPVFDRPWQILLENEIKKGADDRHVIWVYGRNGNEGKSTFGRYLFVEEDWFWTNGGRKNDIFEAYTAHLSLGRCQHVVFNINRASRDQIPSYCAIIENLKDGVFTRGKYNSLTVGLNGNRHVIVMCNYLPDEYYISCDRVRIIRCDADYPQPDGVFCTMLN